MGYLPRFYRGIAYGPDNGVSTASVKELYMLRAEPCRQGGLVPLEWAPVTYNIERFAELYPNYDDASDLRATGPITLVHYRAESMKDLDRPVELEQMTGLSVALAPGGPVPLGEHGGTLAFDDLEQKVGTRLQPSNRPVLANIDIEEQNKFKTSPRRLPWAVYIGAFGTIAALVAILAARRRSWVLLIAPCVVPSAGCSTKPVPHLVAEFAEPELLFESAKASIPADLVVRNEGNVAVRVSGVNAGCSCRDIDESAPPRRLAPGEFATIGMSLSGPPKFSREQFMVTFENDRGNLVAPASLVLLPRHHLTPSSVVINGRYEGDGKGLEFDLIHREVTDTGRFEPAIRLEAPGLVVERTGVREGVVGEVPRWRYRDTSYTLPSDHDRVGLHRSNVVLRSGGRPILDTPVVWRRLPYLSSTPERVVLAGVPTRVFLRCPDADVELDEIVSVPEGVKAFLTSPREVRVMSDGDGLVSGLVEVRTTSNDGQTLKIPVVRYGSNAGSAPPAAGEPAGPT